MLVVVSPSKRIDTDTPVRTTRATQPALLDRSAELVDILRTYSAADLSALMRMSAELGRLNADRFADWTRPFNKSNATQAIYAFRGDVYSGLDASTLEADEIDFTQRHLRILSGLYGVLRPLDLIQPYRLEMGTKLPNQQGNTLYKFWGDTITDELNKQLKKQKTDTLLNLASNEYFSSIQPERIRAKIITPVFKDEKKGTFKVISFFAKKARGAMSRYIIQNRLVEPRRLKAATVDGYVYDANQSTDTEWLFLRSAPT